MDMCDFVNENATPVAARRLAKEVVVAIFVVVMPPTSNSLANFMVEAFKIFGGRGENIDTRL